MKFFEEILQSLSKNAKAKVSDPFIGAFVGSWIFCNWSEVALLFFGDGNASAKIVAFEKYLKETDFFEFNAIFFAPLVLAVLFVFAFPWVSLFIKFLQNIANDRLHKQAISIELGRSKRQELLNKQALISDPTKRFLEKNIEIDIERRKHLVECLDARKKKRVENAAEAEHKANAEKIKLDIEKLEKEKKKRSSEIEKKKFHLENSRMNSALAANRFPSAYMFMISIDGSLRSEGLLLSLAGLSEIVARVFGYADFHSLLNDPEFNNVKLREVVYIKYVPLEFAQELSDIMAKEISMGENLDADVLFDHIYSVFEELGYKLIEEGQVTDLCESIVEENKWSLLDSEDLSGLMAESDTVFDEIYFDSVDSINFDKGFKVVFNGVASGSHRREPDVPGRNISFTLEVNNKLIVGSRALGEFRLGVAKGQLDDFYCDEEE